MRILVLTVALSVLAGLPAHADCTGEIAAATEAALAAGPYHSNLSMTGDGGAMMIVAQVDLPKGMKASITGPVASQFVLLGDKLWVDMGGSWMEMPAALGAMVTSQVPNTMRDIAKSITNATCLGPVDVDGKMLTGYEFDSTVTVAGTQAKSHVKLFVEPATGLPERMEFDGEAGGMKTKGVQVMRFDKTIKIAPPQ